MWWIRNPAPVLAVALGLFFVADSAYAQCVIQSFTEQLNDPEVALIFHGTVKRIDAVTQRIESSNPHGDGLTNDEPGIVSR